MMDLAKFNRILMNHRTGVSKDIPMRTVLGMLKDTLYVSDDTYHKDLPYDEKVKFYNKNMSNIFNESGDRLPIPTDSMRLALIQRNERFYDVVKYMLVNFNVDAITYYMIASGELTDSVTRAIERSRLWLPHEKRSAYFVTEYYYYMIKRALVLSVFGKRFECEVDSFIKDFEFTMDNYVSLINYDDRIEVYGRKEYAYRDEQTICVDYPKQLLIPINLLSVNADIIHADDIFVIAAFGDVIVLWKNGDEYMDENKLVSPYRELLLPDNVDPYVPFKFDYDNGKIIVTTQKHIVEIIIHNLDWSIDGRASKTTRRKDFNVIKRPETE